MTTSSGNEPLLSWWVRGCQRLWQGLLWIWGALILGTGINVGSSWLTASTFPLTKTPLGWLFDHPDLPLAVGGGLLVLTALSGGVTARHRKFLPASSSLILEQQNRQRFLAKLRSRYVDLLTQSLQKTIQIALTFQSTPNAVQNMTRLRVLQVTHSEQDLLLGTSILEVYDQAGGDLLILGAPGAGKTTQLLNLAVALRERATRDEQQPLPVIINLSTWANRKRPIDEWLSEEASTTYNVPRAPLAHWVQQNQFLPLLDGLDEVPEVARAACIDAINAFREAYLVPVVVCSRSQEYAAQQSHLTLQNAVEVQPLEAGQVDAYFKAIGKPMAGIRSLLRNDAELRELVSTPLMLHVVTSAYYGVSIQALPKKGTHEEQRRQIFAQYVQRRLERHDAAGLASSQQAQHWLSWLARQMRIHNQTIFYFEHLQFDWLPEGRERDRYERLSTRGAGIIIGVLVSLLITTLVPPYSFFLTVQWLVSYGCIGGLLGGVISGKGSTRFSLSGIRPLIVRHWRKVGLLGVCVGSLLGGLVATGCALWGGPEFAFPYWMIIGSSLSLCSGVLTVLVVLGKLAGERLVLPVRRTHWWHRVLPRGFTVDVLELGLLIGLLLGLSVGLAFGLSSALNVGLRGGLYGIDSLLGAIPSYGAIGMFLGLLLMGKMGTIELAERLLWSRKQILRSLLNKRHLGESVLLFLLLFLFYGLDAGLNDRWSNFNPSDALIFGLSIGLSVGLSIGSAYWLLLGLWKGLSRETLDDHVRTRPNQGILRSVRNALLVGGLTWIICFLVGPINQFISGFSQILVGVGLSNQPESGLSNGLSLGLSDGLSNGLSLGLSSGLLLGCTGFLLAALLTGGLASLRHLLLRWQLRHLGVVPRHYVRFLDDAARRILLYKDGGGYRFIHPLFRDYFADLEVAPSLVPSGEQGTGIAQGATTGVTATPRRS